MLSHLLLLLPLQHQWGLLHAAYNELFFFLFQPITIIIELKRNFRMLSPPGGQRERRTKSLNAILAIM